MPISYLADISTSFQRVRVNYRDVVRAETPGEAQIYIDTIKQLSAEIDKRSAEYQQLILSKEMQALYDTQCR